MWRLLPWESPWQYRADITSSDVIPEICSPMMSRRTVRLFGIISDTLGIGVVRPGVECMREI